MQADSYEAALERILQRDPRYHRDAYAFVREALDHTQKALGRSSKTKHPHVTGQELLAGLRDYALQQFGPMTLTVFHEWGLRSCTDFGDIVFNMVENHLLSKTEQDSRDDFKQGYDFQEAFRRPFLPTREASPRLSSTDSGQA